MDTIILDNSTVETVIIRISEFPESSRKWDDITNKPAVIAAGDTIQEALEQIGLENVNAEITSLQDTKVDKVAGKSLILDTEITRLSTVTNQDTSNLVVKDGTKVLSDVNFSTAKDTKLSGIDTGAQVNAIDSITTTGTSGAATLVGKVLNIPQYSGGGGGGSTDWNDITNKPIVIGAGATQSDARAAIGAGTSNLTLGLTNTTAKAGDYTPSMSDVTGLNTALSNKVDKVAGKSLINDTEITRLTGIATGATANDTDANLKNTDNHTNGIINKVFTAVLLAKINSITEIFTTALKTAYDNAVTWISTNGANLINHLSATNNPHNVTKTQVGLSNVDNTSDVNKPISTAQSTALGLKVDKVTGKSLINDSEIIRLSTVVNQTIPVTSVAGKTGAVTLGKVDVGLGSVDNIADAAKEVLSATKLATARKINGVDFDGTANITVISPSNLALGTRTDTTQPITNDNGSGFTLPVATTTLAGLLSGTLKTAYDSAVTWVSTNGANVLSHLSSTSNPHNVTKTQVGLSNVDNTADTAKPVSTAQQAALDLKAPLASPTFTGAPSLPTGTTGVTQTAGDNSTKLATTAYVKTAVDAVTSSVTLLKGTTTANGTNVKTNYYKDVTLTGASVNDNIIITNDFRRINNTSTGGCKISANVISTNTIRLYFTLLMNAQDSAVPVEDPSSTSWTINYAVIK